MTIADVQYIENAVAGRLTLLARGNERLNNPFDVAMRRAVSEAINEAGAALCLRDEPAVHLEPWSMAEVTTVTAAGAACPACDGMGVVAGCLCACVRKLLEQK